MVIIKTKNYSNIFINKYLKKLYINLLKSNAIKEKSMNDFLKNNYNISLFDIINTYEKNIIFNETNNENILLDNTYVKINNYRLDMLIRLIDYGNSEIKGVNLFNSTIKDIRENISLYHKIYLLNRGSKIWQ